MARAKFKAFVKSKANQDAVAEFLSAQSIAEDNLVKGDITKAYEAFEDELSPLFLLVELTSKNADKSFEELDKLAGFCEPDTKVIVCGAVDELSFYKDLINMGVAEYLLNPVKPSQLEKALDKKSESGDDKPAAAVAREDSQVIAVCGSRGGAGASFLATNLAGICASRDYPTAILDLDPEFGTIPLMTDVEASRGFVDALEKPDRVDSLFLDRVMTKVNDSLYVIGAEKSLADMANIDPDAAEHIINQLRAKFAYIIVDIPRIEPYAHHVLQNYDTILVTELSIGGLRDTMRIVDLVSDTLKNKDLTIVANKVGLNKKFETPQKDFESGLGQKIDYLLPFETDYYGFNDSGRILSLETNKKSKLIAAINDLSLKFMPEGVSGAAKPDGKKGKDDKKKGKDSKKDKKSGMFGGGKKK